MVGRWVLAWVAVGVAMAAPPELAAGSEPAAWRFAHPDAQIVGGADLFRLGQSPAGEQLRQRFLAAMGPELSRHVQRLLVTTTFLAGGETDTLVILSGPLDAARIRQMAARGGAVTKLHRGIEVILPPGGGPRDPHFAIVDAQTALIGTRMAVRSAIDRARVMDGPMTQVNPLYARALDMAAEADVWVVTEDLPAGFAPAEVERLGAAAGGVELALQVKPESRLAISIATAEPAALATAMAAARRTPPTGTTLDAWLDTLGVSAGEEGVLLGAALTEEKLLDGFPVLGAALGLPIQPRGTAAAAAPKAPARPAAAEAPKPPPPPMVVRIEGLEGGPVEIPYPVQQP